MISRSLVVLLETELRFFGWSLVVYRACCRWVALIYRLKGFISLFRYFVLVLVVSFSSNHSVWFEL